MVVVVFVVMVVVMVVVVMVVVAVLGGLRCDRDRDLVSVFPQLCLLTFLLFLQFVDGNASVIHLSTIIVGSAERRTTTHAPNE